MAKLKVHASFLMMQQTVEAHLHSFLFFFLFIRILTSHRPFSFLCQSELGQDFTCHPPCLLARQVINEPPLSCQQMNNWPAAGRR